MTLIGSGIDDSSLTPEKRTTTVAMTSVQWSSAKTSGPI